MRRIFREDTGLEFMPDNVGRPTVKAIRNTYRSDKTRKGRNSELEIKQITENPAPEQLKTAKAIYKILRRKGKDQEVTQKFDDTPDVVLKGNGDAQITPDNSDKSYEISAEEIDEVLNENRFRWPKARRMNEAEQFLAQDPLTCYATETQASNELDIFTENCIEISTSLIPNTPIQSRFACEGRVPGFDIDADRFHITVDIQEDEVYVLTVIDRRSATLVGKGAGVGLDYFVQDYKDMIDHVLR